MARVLVIAIGSHGDVAPYAGVGAALRTAGHEVTIAADRSYADVVTGAGLGFEPLGLDLKPQRANETQRRYFRDGLFSRSGLAMLRAAKGFLRAANRDVARLAATPDVDVLLLNPLAGAGWHVARARGIRSAGLHLGPQQPTSAFPPYVIGRSLGPRGNRLAWAALARGERLAFAGIDEIRAGHGLPPTTPAEVRREQAAEDWPVLHGYSPHVLPRPGDWRPGLTVTGYWWPPVPADWTPPARLTDFLAAGPPPVFVGLGSSDPGDAERISGTVAAALRAAGRRGVLQAGWAGLHAENDDLITIDDVPHEWLFPRCAAVVHAASAGVTGAGLRAGVPAVPVPMTGDQPFWARRLVALGVAPAVVPFQKLTAARLAGAIRATPDHAPRAAELAPQVAGDPGTRAVVDFVNRS